jgi:uncharacterized protein YggE
MSLSVIALAAVVVLGAVWVYGLATSPALAQTGEDAPASSYNPSETITVVGQGSSKMSPDVAHISIGVETSSETVSEGVAENEAKMELVLEALEDLGIEAVDIQTSNYSIQLDRYPEPLPRAEGPGEEAKPVYRISNMVRVTVRDLDKVGEVLDAVVEAGANSVWGVSFGLSDPKAAEAEARADAVADAQERAGALAELAGIDLGPVLSMSEVVGGGGVISVTREMAASAGGPISPGEVEVSYQVQVVYAIAR